MIGFFIISMFITYFLGIYQIFSIGTYGVTSLDLVLAGLYLYIIKRLIWNGDAIRTKWHPALYALIMLLASALLSGLMPIFIHNSNAAILQYFKTTSHFFLYSSFAVFCFLYPMDYKIWMKGLKLWLVLGLLINIFGIYQIVARAYDLPLAWINFTNLSMTARGSSSLDEVGQLSIKFENFYRATSIFSEPSALAGFDSLLMILYAIPYLQYKKPLIRSKLFNSISLSFCIIALFLTFSVTGFTATGLTLLGVFVFQRSKRMMHFLKYMAIGCLILIATDSIVNNYLGQSVIELFKIKIVSIFELGSETRESTEGDSMEMRASSAADSYKLWKENPIIGIGLGLSEYSKAVVMTYGNYSVLAALTDMGIPGFVAFNLLFFFLFVESRKYLHPDFLSDRIPDELKTLLGIIFYLMLILADINYLAGNALVSPVLWMFIGLILSLINSYYLYKGDDSVEIRLVSKPLKTRFSELINIYLEKRPLPLQAKNNI